MQFESKCEFESKCWIWICWQCKFVREYPAEFVLVFFYNFWALVLALPVGIASEPHLSSWKIPVDVRFFSILYSVTQTHPFCGGSIQRLIRFLSLFVIAGNNGIRIRHHDTYMGFTCERPGLRSVVQAIIYCNCSHFGCHFSWRWSLSGNVRPLFSPYLVFICNI